MSWTPCPVCGAPLQGRAGSPCTDPKRHAGVLRAMRAFAERELEDDPAQRARRERHRAVLQAFNGHERLRAGAAIAVTRQALEQITARRAR